MKSIKSISNRFSYASIILRQLVKTDFKLRYQGSALGYVWSVLKPLFLFGILYVVFVKIVGVDYGVENDGIYLLLGIVLWTFFAELTGGSVTSIVGKGDLLRKLNFPRYVIVLAVAFSALLNLFLNMIIVLLFLVIAGTEITLSVFLAPLLFVELFVFALAIGFFLSTTFVRFRDINYIWEVLMQALFYLSPIIFPIGIAPFWMQKILVLNPIAQILQDLRYILISKQTVTISHIYGNNMVRVVPILIVLFSIVASAFYFRKKSKYFAEEL